MNDPGIARERERLVRRAKSYGLSKRDAWSTIKYRWTDDKFEGHALKKTIDRIYD